MITVSAPGRTEICGNHTDHQRGCVLAAAVTLDMAAVVSAREDGKIRLISEGFGADEVDLADLSPKPDEAGRSASLIRGVCAGFRERGFAAGGFDAWQISGVPKGSGLSSSAAFEVLIGAIENALYNGGGAADPVTVAKIGQYAENTYFGKPSGLMDQTASSVGGVVAIDFRDADNPLVERIDVSFAGSPYELCIVNAGGSHADLTNEYAAIPAEMGLVASFFGKQLLSEVDPAAFYQSIGALRANIPDRAVLRAMHFFGETQTARDEAAALKKGDFEEFARLAARSGHSSMSMLQNCWPADSVSERSVALALALSGRVLAGRGAVRVHGGGFAGTVMAVVPREAVTEYIGTIEQAFGKGCVYVLRVRPVGGAVIAPGGPL